MITLRFVVVIISLLAFGLLLLLAGLRLRSKKSTVIHLFVFAGLGFLSNLFQLMTVLGITALWGISYGQLAQLTLLGMTMAFGALTLSFLNKERNVLIGYWVASAIILLLWGIFAFDAWGVGKAMSMPVAITTLAVLGVGWLHFLMQANQ